LSDFGVVAKFAMNENHALTEFMPAMPSGGGVFVPSGSRCQPQRLIKVNAQDLEVWEVTL
jgi:hypothetical protein